MSNSAGWQPCRPGDLCANCRHPMRTHWGKCTCAFHPARLTCNQHCAACACRTWACQHGGARIEAVPA